MMKLETERLELVVLTIPQLALWITDIPQLEKELNCAYQAEPVAGVFKEIVAGQLREAEANYEQAIWYSFWFMIRKSDRAVVGSADF